MLEQQQNENEVLRDVAQYHAKESDIWSSLKAIGPHWDYMAVFSAHLDDSGTHANSPSAIVGGIILSEQGSTDFQRAWCHTLSKPEYGIKVFHAADCDAGYGEFRGWSRDKRYRLSLELASIVSTCACDIIAYGVKPKDFHTIWKELCLSEIGMKNDVYRVLLQLCWHELGAFAHSLPATDTLAIYVEKGNKRASFINDLYQKVNNDPQARGFLNIEEIAFIGKNCFPLQAADLLVHEIYKYHPNWGTDVIGDVLQEMTKNHDRNSIKLLNIGNLRRLMLEVREYDRGFRK